MTETSSPARVRPPHRPGLPARRAAIEILHRVLAERRPLDAVLARSAESGSMADLAPKDRAFARAVVSTALRRKGQIDDVIGRFVEKPIDRNRTGAVYEAILAGAAQILFLGTPEHAAIDLSVSAVGGGRTGGRKAGGFVNALLRRIAREGPDLVNAQDAARLSAPGWLYESWTKAYGGPPARAIAEAHLTEPPLDLVVKSDRDAWARTLSATAVGARGLRLTAAGRVERLDGYAEGAWWVQDAAAALPVTLFGEIDGKRALDLCAAPGGKTAQLATCGAKVVAVDVSAPRLARLKRNLERLRLDADCVQADLLALDATEPADAVLLDAPCSATGTIRRHPDIPHVKTKGDVRNMVALQTRMLRKAAALTKPGGLLVYCVCSLQPEEGERQAAKLLASDATLERAPIAAREIAGLRDAVTPDGDLRTLPSHDPGAPGGMDGFYVCRLRKRS